MNLFFTLADTVTDAAPAASASGSSAGNLMLLITVFVLAVFVGVEIITKIPPTLHTPLMSGSNAISGITLLGAIMSTGADDGRLATVLGFLAIVLATMNVVGGFVVTNRMLSMFRTNKK
ncbi:MAG: NAD(P) transhydrogenase subunit alpha [Planctomycetaceae bacterium]|nr:NAD(P) transhydrogenase subunit alpha [Planctomycetaceae bacterium]